MAAHRWRSRRQLEGALQVLGRAPGDEPTQPLRELEAGVLEIPSSRSREA
jgi:hypothetical protein